MIDTTTECLAHLLLCIDTCIFMNPYFGWCDLSPRYCCDEVFLALCIRGRCHSPYIFTCFRQARLTCPWLTGRSRTPDYQSCRHKACNSGQSPHCLLEIGSTFMTKVIGKKHFFFTDYGRWNKISLPNFREREREYIGDVIDINKWCNVS